ncbi:MAG TPA: autotransporter domain-containing protein [Sphingobium sp.]
MRHLLFLSTCMVAIASGAAAETVISTKQTTPVRTSTIKQGAADDIKIAPGGSIELAAGTPILVDSANKVTNEGKLQVTGANAVSGILVMPGRSGGIVNTGKIIVDEVHATTDSDNDGDADGPFAAGTARFGIQTMGAYNGDIVQSGEITVLGNDSYGIELGGPLTGKLTHDGTTSVTGDNAVGIQINDVTGAVRLAGTITAKGVGANAARLDGNVAGTLTVQGALSATGYRYTNPPANTSKLDADDLLQGGSALVIGGDVSGGIILATAPKDTNPNDADEDKDGIEDAKEGSAAVRSYGGARAMTIGAATRNITIGEVPGSAYGLVIDGLVQGSGVYKDVAGRGLQVGGLGGTVDIEGGILVNGVVGADSLNASASAMRIGAGATVPVIRVNGRVEAKGSDAMSTIATGIVVDEGASVYGIRNTGTIKATALGEAGTAVAIMDLSGSVSLIENSGLISATGAKADSGRNVAIDVSEQSSNVMVRQAAGAAGSPAPSIVGNIVYGGGNDLLEVSAGSVKGVTLFGAGNDVMKLMDNAVYEGRVLFGDGNATMSLSGTSKFIGTANFAQMPGTLSVGAGALFQGKLDHAHGVALTVAGGTLDLGAPANLTSLTINNKGTLGVMLGQAGSTTPLITVSGAANFAPESKLVIRVSDLQHAVGTHVLLTADNVTGSNNLTASALQLPYFYKAAVQGTGKQVDIIVTRRLKTEMGLNRSEDAAFDAVYAALAKDAKVASVFLALPNEQSMRATLQQMLPDHAGGTFSVVTQGSRAFQRMLEDRSAPFKDEGDWGYWISQAGWGQSKAIGATAGFETSGWGIGTGFEFKTGLGHVGVSLAYLRGRNRDRGSAGRINANQYELAGYWRLEADRLQVNTRGSIAFIDLSGTRSFEGMDGSQKVSLTSHSDRSARLYSGSAMVAYQIGDGRIGFRPVASIDYYRIHERGYTETGGGQAFDLAVRSRTSDELTLNASGVLSLGLGDYSSIEIEGGRREIISGSLGRTVAQYAGGTPFTLTPEGRTSGWLGRIRGATGNRDFRIGTEFSAEQQQGKLALALRANLRVGL